MEFLETAVEFWYFTMGDPEQKSDRSPKNSASCFRSGRIYTLFSWK